MGVQAKGNNYDEIFAGVSLVGRYIALLPHAARFSSRLDGLPAAAFESLAPRFLTQNVSDYSHRQLKRPMFIFT